MLACTLGRTEDSKYDKTSSWTSCSSLARLISHTSGSCHSCTKAVGRTQVTAMNIPGRWREEAVTLLLPPGTKGRAEWTPGHTTQSHAALLLHTKAKLDSVLSNILAPLLSIADSTLPEMKFKTALSTTIEEHDLKIAWERHGKVSKE